MKLEAPNRVEIRVSENHQSGATRNIKMAIRHERYAVSDQGFVKMPLTKLVNASSG
jgi:hypothetical protein